MDDGDQLIVPSHILLEPALRMTDDPLVHDALIAYASSDILTPADVIGSMTLSQTFEFWDIIVSVLYAAGYGDQLNQHFQSPAGKAALAEGIRYVDETEGRAILDRQTRKYLDMSAEEFIRQLQNGELARCDSGVARCSILVPLAED